MILSQRRANAVFTITIINHHRMSAIKDLVDALCTVLERVVPGNQS